MKKDEKQGKLLLKQQKLIKKEYSRRKRINNCKKNEGRRCDEVGRKGYLSSKARKKEGGINKKGKGLSWQKYKVTRKQTRDQQG